MPCPYDEHVSMRIIYRISMQITRKARVWVQNENINKKKIVNTLIFSILQLRKVYQRYRFSFFTYNFLFRILFLLFTTFFFSIAGVLLLLCIQRWESISRQLQLHIIYNIHIDFFLLCFTFLPAFINIFSLRCWCEILLVRPNT